MYYSQIIEMLQSRHLKYKAMVIGIDGIDASGKTCFAHSLASELKRDGYSCQLIHLDDFHHPSSVRRNTNLPPAQAYYRNTFDYFLLITQLLRPIHNGVSINKELLCLDLEKDEYCVRRQYIIDQETIVILEGVFLFRPELSNFIHLKIHLQIDFDCCLERVVTRDGYLFGSTKDIISRYKNKYIPGQILYFQGANPLTQADLVINNTNFETPRLKN